MILIGNLLSGAIGGIIVFFLMIIRDGIIQKRKFLGILKGEIEQNIEFLQSNRTEGKKLYFREDGWLAFRNQGGFNFISRRLYNSLVKHYTILYELNGLIKKSREFEDKNSKKEMEEYEEIFEQNLKCLQSGIEKERWWKL